MTIDRTEAQHQLRRAAVRCAIYTRKSTEEGLEQDFNTLDAQREASEAFIKSQTQEGWQALTDRYDDGGFTGANMDRPALQRLLEDIKGGRVNCVVVYKVDRLTRSLMDFAKIVEVLDKYGVSFVSVTQQFNTTSSLGRLTLHILLSFAQFEREMIAERTRDKMSAARRKGKWVGGVPVLGYDVSPKGGSLVVNEGEAERVRAIFDMYLEYGSLMPVIKELDHRGWALKAWTTRRGTRSGRRAVFEDAALQPAHQRHIPRQSQPSRATLRRRATADRQHRSLAARAAAAEIERQDWRIRDPEQVWRDPQGHPPVQELRRGHDSHLHQEDSE